MSSFSWALVLTSPIDQWKTSQEIPLWWILPETQQPKTSENTGAGWIMGRHCPLFISKSLNDALKNTTWCLNWYHAHMWVVWQIFEIQERPIHGSQNVKSYGGGLLHWRVGREKGMWKQHQEAPGRSRVAFHQTEYYFQPLVPVYVDPNFAPASVCKSVNFAPDESPVHVHHQRLNHQCTFAPGAHFSSAVQQSPAVASGALGARRGGMYGVVHYRCPRAIFKAV